MGGGTTLPSSSSTAAASTSAGVKLTAHTKHTEYPHNSKQTVVGLASLEAELPENGAAVDARAPIDLVCVIDRSGSMAGAKLNLVKQTMEFVFRQLRPVDRFALVSYDSDVRTDLGLTCMDTKGMDAAHKAVTQLNAGSCTNLSGGLFEGLSLVDKRTDPAKVCSVLLFTDGLANEGISDKNQLRDALTKRMTRTTGCSIYTFGFGSDHDAEMLQMIASCAGGVYYFIEGVDRIPSAFADCLGGLQSVVAQNMRLKIFAEPGATVTKVYNGKYTMTGTVPASGSGSVQLSLGDIFDGESKDIVVEIDIPALSEPKPDNHAIARFELTYFSVTDAGDHSVTAHVNIARPANVPAERPINERVELQVGRVKTAEAIEESRRLADTGRLEEARERLTSMKAQIAASAASATPYAMQMAQELESMSDDMASASVYQMRGKSNMVSREQAYHQQRSTKATMADEEDVFETKNKKMAKAKAFSFFNK